ncbi:hypothetical protein HPB47_003508 [Ixodes persulcatus]|uniref:Uncharacterized protein n=1 Tax=Ixodes persulcatus TaxID=34615 RepID=A0AC60PJ99_IXOPE|nr:hypothetical protein HPB47_003508 [Ixodes persulcatus]
MTEPSGLATQTDRPPELRAEDEEDSSDTESELGSGPSSAEILALMVGMSTALELVTECLAAVTGETGGHQRRVLELRGSTTANKIHAKGDKEGTDLTLSCLPESGAEPGRTEHDNRVNLDSTEQYTPADKVGLLSPIVGGLSMELPVWLCRSTCRASGAAAVREGGPRMSTADTANVFRMGPEGGGVSGGRVLTFPDGASVMMGKNNSVMTLLKKDIPDIFVLTCVCHSFHLCASYACAKLPRVIEDIVRDVYNYISLSPKRVDVFQKFQRLLELKPHKLLRPTQTRWLSLHAAVARVLEQYDALTAYFAAAASTERLLAPATIHERLADPVNKLFLEFVDFILPSFTNLNRLMQSERPQLHIFREAASTSVRTIMDCYLQGPYVRSTPVEDIQYKNPTYFVPLEQMYLGANVAMSLSSPSLKVSQEQVRFFKLRCLEFLIEGVGQIMQRIPFKSSALVHMDILTPKKVREGKNASIIPLAASFPRLLQEIGAQSLDNEWRRLRNTPLEELPQDELFEEFWTKLFRKSQGDGTQAFPSLERFVSAVLCLPHSSAAAERIFSAVNNMKTKQRNRLATSTVSGLLYTKQMLGSSSCFDFPIGKELLEMATNWRQRSGTNGDDDD